MSQYFKKATSALFILILLSNSAFASTQTECKGKNLAIQVLGSGGPEIDDNRASTAYLIWIKGKARILVDMGTGSINRFEASAARLNDIDLILMTHFHVDHSNDLPAFIKASYFTGRNRDLALYGPSGNHLMPSAVEFTHALFDDSGAYRYLNSYITQGADDYRLIAHNVNADETTVHPVISNQDYAISAVAVHHGPVPAIAWRIDIDGQSFVFSGDMSNKYQSLSALAKDADILVAHNAVPEDASEIARNLHMPPSIIGRIAGEAKVRQLVLSHRMNRTLGREDETTAYIRQRYSGKINYANDLDCFIPLHINHLKSALSLTNKKR